MSFLPPQQLPGTPTSLAVAMVNSATNATTYAKFNSSTSHPTVANDSTQGYTTYSYWNCTADNTIWVCSSAASGAAVWKNITGYGIFDVTNFGAKGDGTTNDYAAINAAVTAMTNAGGGVVYFPPGKTYRITTQGTFVHIDQKSNWSWVMGMGSVIVLDNLDGSSDGTGHGLYVTGPCSNITIIGVHIKYVQMAVDRDVWAPFYFLGANVGEGDNSNPNGWVRGAYPNPNETPSGILAGAVSNVVLRDCISENSPSTFCGIVGVDTITIQNFTGIKSWADGLYHLYFRRSQIQGVRLFNCGDDGISMASYESDVANANIENDFHGEGSNVSDVYMQGVWPTDGTAPPAGSTVLLGVRDVVFNNVVLDGKYGGIRIATGTSFSLDYPNLNLNFLAPRRVIFQGYTIRNYTQAIQFSVQESNLQTDPKWWQSDILICDVIADGGDTPIDVNGLGAGQLDGGLVYGVHFKNLKFTRYTSGFTSINQIYSCKFEDVQFDGLVFFYGSVPFSLDPDAKDGSGNPLWADNLCAFINVQAQDLYFQGLKRSYIENAFSFNAAQTGITISTCSDLTFGTIRAIYYNRSNSENGIGVYIDQYCKRITGNLVEVEQDAMQGLGLSLYGTKNHFIKYVKIQTDQNTYFQQVADQRWATEKVSQIERIDFFNTAAMPGWLTVPFPTDPTVLVDDQDADLYLHTLANTLRYGAPLTANRICTVHEDGASIGDEAMVSRLGSCTGAFTLTVKGQDNGKDAVGEVTAMGSFVLTAALDSTDKITSVKVNGVEQLHSGTAIAYDPSTGLVGWASAIANSIGATALYNAYAVRNAVVLQALDGTGSTPNGYVVALTKVGTHAAFTAVVNMTGGVNAAAAVSPGAPYTIIAGASAGANKFVGLRYVIPEGGGSPKWEYTYGTM